MKKSISTVSLLFLLISISFSQTKEFDKIGEAYLKSAGIIENNGIKNGYYFFYQYDEVSKDNFTYILDLIDAEYNPIKKINIIRPKNDNLLECVFNGSHFFLTFVNKKSEMEIVSYSIDEGKEVSKITKKLNFMELSMVMAKTQTDQLANNIIPISNKDVIKINQKAFSTEGFSVECYDSNLKNKWKYQSLNKEKLTELPDYLGSNEKYILLTVTRYELKLNSELKQSILLLDAKTGKIIFENELNTSRNKKLYTNCYIEENTSNIVVVGEYFSSTENVNNAKSLGIYFDKYDNSGKLIFSKQLGWKNDFSKFIKLSANGTNEDGAYTYFHKLIKTSDNKYFIIGEQFKKPEKGKSVAAKVISHSASSTMDFTIIDMVSIELDSDFNITQYKTYPKTQNIVVMPGQYAYLSPTLIARTIALYNYFDYLFTTIDKTNNKFYASYISLNRDKEITGKEVSIGTIGYDSGLLHEKFNIKSDASSVRILEGKPGYITIAEYYKKKKTIKIRLEKIFIE